MHLLGLATAVGTLLIATGGALLAAADPDLPRALFAAAAALLCPLALVRSFGG